MTTAGQIVPEPLGKSQCSACGLVQRTSMALLAETDFYEKNYHFYDRPGAELFDRDRYAAMADWIAAALTHQPARVLDAGCGRGWMIEAMSHVFPGARFTGIEPSEQESANARANGHEVISDRITKNMSLGQRFDLAYSTNVLEHTISPADFLHGLRSLLEPGGTIVITCADATHVGAEIMFSDQNFSFLPAHLHQLAERANLQVVSWQAAPSHVGLRDKQLAVLKEAASRVSRPGVITVARRSLKRLYELRCDYLNSWTVCNATLAQVCQGARTVYNFGASTWSYLLAGYCPDYWALVTWCMIDRGSGEFFGKPVCDAGEVVVQDGDVIVMGVDPDTQHRWTERFADSPAKLVTWSDIIAK